MKIALYIEDGLEQIVLTPETDTERSMLAKIDNRDLEIHHGQFYACKGGWTRQGERGEDSTIIVLLPERDE